MNAPGCDLWDCYVLVITAWASALLVLLEWAMLEPWNCGTSDKIRFHAFLFLAVINFAWESAKTKFLNNEKLVSIGSVHRITDDWLQLMLCTTGEKTNHYVVAKRQLVHATLFYQNL